VFSNGRTPESPLGRQEKTPGFSEKPGVSGTEKLMPRQKNRYNPQNLPKAPAFRMPNWEAVVSVPSTR
jgi:hypothetical protein